MTRFTPAQVSALAALHAAWPDHPIRLIGAAALAHHVPMDWRHTSDLDLTIAADFDAIDASLERLPGWHREPRIEHRWRSPGDVKIDIVPAAPHHLAKGSITWPASGHVMSVEGLELAFQHADVVPLTTCAIVSIARLPVLVVLKMTAWQESVGRERERDLADIAHVFDRHLGFDDDRRYGDDVYASGLPYDHLGAFVMGARSRASRSRSTARRSPASSTSWETHRSPPSTTCFASAPAHGSATRTTRKRSCPRASPPSAWDSARSR